jgi:hypothetical protein
MSIEDTHILGPSERAALRAGLPLPPGLQPKPTKVEPTVYRVDETGKMVRVDQVFLKAGIAANQTANEQLLRVVSALAATGSDAETISKTLGMELAKVRELLGTKAAAVTIARIQSVFYPEAGQRVKKLANLALDTILTVMLTADKDETRLKAAQDLADRAMGKAVQVTENRNLNFNVNEVNSLDQSIEMLQKKIDDTQRMLALKKSQSAEPSKANAISS